MNMSKQQKQILLVLLQTKSREIHYRLTEIVSQIERATIGYSSGAICQSKIVSFTRSMQRLKQEGLVLNDGSHWHLTDSGFRAANDVKHEIKEYIEDAKDFERILGLKPF